ncbi:hypothetical protein QQS21_011912 [Conoideocrella luteorostrata]|uniref:Zn(2)-C6 fungal-type domain-containing protein n=1 Tax=Conoideocrella luteorostrata TaxID=1105319 RepID=A0AAJ0CEY1_9HYPO|nr:hypothetical protein QQS21_011912 [Conoideocrella luteorostrata]
MNSGSVSKSSQNRACLECQKRKTRCVSSPHADSCTYCVRARKECVFEVNPTRTPLTRKNFDALEKRCAQLETALRTLSGRINVDKDLEQLAKDNANHAATDSGQTEETNLAEPAQDPETTEGSPNSYEWIEAVHISSGHGEISDRDAEDYEMASMAARGSGYLGNTSVSDILRTISGLVPGFETPASSRRHRTPRREQRHRRADNLVVNASLFSDVVAGRLIDAYFSYYNTSYPIIHEKSFKRQREHYKHRMPSAASTSCWMATQCTVLAIGQWTLDDEPQASSYFAAARSWLSARALESGTVGALQAFLLMANYIQKRGKPNTGYNMIGIAYRMALGLGMHREMTDPRQDTLRAERRRLLFWILFCFDSGLSITTGRPMANIDSFIDVKLPRNIDDSSLDLGESIPEEINSPTQRSAMIAQTHLAGIANEIYTAFWSAKTPQVETNHDIALTMEVKLFSWRNSLPRYFTASNVPDWFLGPRAIVLWKEQNLRILLWRSSQRRQSVATGKSVAKLKCHATAVETIKDISIFCEEHENLLHMGLNWYATYFLFQAVLVLEVNRVENPGPMQPSQEHAHGPTYGSVTSEAEILSQGRKCLQMLKKPNSAAGRCIETLDRISSPTTSSAASGKRMTPPPSDRRHNRSHLQPGDDSSDLQDAGSSSGPVDTITPDSLAMDWTTFADPSLQMLLDDRQMDEAFRGLEGFPGTLDQDSFNYMGGYTFSS